MEYLHRWRELGEMIEAKRTSRSKLSLEVSGLHCISLKGPSGNQIDTDSGRWCHTPW